MLTTIFMGLFFIGFAVTAIAIVSHDTSSRSEQATGGTTFISALVTVALFVAMLVSGHFTGWPSWW